MTGGTPMISRRALAFGLAGFPWISGALPGLAQTAAEAEPVFSQLIYPPIEALDDPVPFGYQPATQEQIRRAADIISQTPKGPRPIDIAQSFVDRFFEKEPKLISQWPAPESWNPLVVEF